MKPARKYSGRFKSGIVKWVAVLAPVWFGLVILFAGAFTPGYVHLSQAISELGASNTPYAPVVNFIGFIPLGCSVVLLAFAVNRDTTRRVPETILKGLLGMTGIAILVAGIFPTDPGGRRDTLSGMVHALAGITLLITAGVTPIIVALLPSQPNSKRFTFRIYSLATGISLVALFLMLPNGLIPELIELHHKILGELFPIWYKYHGVHQRVFMGIYFVWLAIFTRLSLNDRIDS